MTISSFLHGYALVVGVGSDLPVTVDDATAIHNILIDPHRGAYSPTNTRLLTNSQATRGGILDGLHWLREHVQKDADATVVVYFSGHGGFVPEYQLVPFGFDWNDLATTAISGIELTEQLRLLQAKKLLILLDCCHAGGMAEAKTTSFVKSPVPPEINVMLNQGSGRVVIASSRKDEVSYTGRPYSVFTQALIEGLSGYGAAEQDGYAYVADVAMYLGRVVPHRTNDKQHPILKLAAADNFAISYYAGGNKSPVPITNPAPFLVPANTQILQQAESYRSLSLNQLRYEINRRFDDAELDAFCLDNFPDVYDKFSRGMRKDEKISLLLNSCRRSDKDYDKLVDGLKG